MTMTLEEVQKKSAEYKTRIEAYEQGLVKPYRRNKCYVTDFEMPFVAQQLTAPNDQVQGVFTVDNGTRFYAKSGEVTVVAVGALALTGQAASVTLAARVRREVFDFVWKVYDTGSDREWQNRFIPSTVLLTGNLNGFRLNRAHFVVSGGSQVVVTLGILRMVNNAETLLTAITSIRVKLSFSGVEVVL